MERLAFRELVGAAVKLWRWFGLVAVTGLVLGVLPLGWPARAQQGETSSAVVDYGACLAGQRRGDLLLLMDESGSLAGPKGSDPNAARVPAAQRLLAKLAEWTANTQVQLDVAIAGFGDTFTMRQGWVSLNDQSLPALNSVIEGTANRTQGFDTNYGIALSESLRTLTDHRPEANPVSCRAIAWFTDGDLDFGTTEEPLHGDLITTTRKAICHSGGIADQVRASGIRTFAIGLGGARSSNGGPATPPDFSLLESIATGKKYNGEPCGDIVTPRPGEFYAANNIDELIAKFTAIAPTGTVIVTNRPVCSGEVRADCKHNFVLDNSIRAVSVEANGGAAGLIPSLIAPDGSATALDRDKEGIVTVGGVSVAYRWTSDRDLSFKMVETAGAQWRGVWALAFIDNRHAAGTAQSKSSITIYGNLVPTWTEQSRRTLHSQEHTQLQLGIADRDGKAVDPAGIEGSAELSVSIIERSGTEHRLAVGLGKEAIGQPVAVDLGGIAPGAATLRLSLAITTAPSGNEPGTALTPEPLDVPVTIATPEGFPEIGKLEFKTLSGAGEFTAVLPISGAGCVWLSHEHPPVFATRPEGIGAMALTSSAPTSSADCVPGASASSIPFVLKIEHQANGIVSGTIPVTAARPNEIEGAITIDVPFHAKVEKLPRAVSLWTVLALTLVLGPGLPLLLLYLMKWFTTRIPAQILKVQRFEVRVTDTAVLRDGAPFALRDTDLVDSVPELHRSARAIDLGGITLRTRTGWSPISRGHVVVHAPGMVGASSVEPRTDAHGNAVLPLALRSTWFVLHDPAGSPQDATLVLLLGGGASAAQRSGLATDAGNTVPALIAGLRQRGRSGDRAEPPPSPAGNRPDDPFASRYGGPSDSDRQGWGDPFSR